MAPYTVNSAATSEHNGTLKVLRRFKNILPICIWRSYMHYPGKTSDMPRM